MDRDSSEIAKLAERIAKDPKSKLFVPLAEEYKKTGDIEMAIHVLTEGLKNNPGYVTARAFLGRLLIENGDLVGAQKELEDVIKAIPDKDPTIVTTRSIKDTTIALEESLTGEFTVITGEDAKRAKEEFRKKQEQAKLEEQLSAKEEEIRKELSAYLSESQEEESSDDASLAVPEEESEEEAGDDHEEGSEGSEE